MPGAGKRLVGLLLAAALGAATDARAQAPIDSLAWLAGCWTAEGAEAGSVEHWLPPAAGTMFGVNRAVRGGRMSQFEFMLLRTGADGRLVFVAWPGGRNETEFPLASLDADEAVFQRSGAGFPQRVVYRRTGPDRMLGRIEGESNGARRSIDFPFLRAPCPGGACGC